MRSFGRPRVLIVDDELGVLQACSVAMTHAGYEPVVAHSGTQAVEAAQRATFDVALVDVRLPDQDGPEVIAALHQQDLDLPCVVMSGHASFHDTIRCMREGAVDFVAKPFDVETLVRTVDRALATTHLKSDSALLAATRSIFVSLRVEEVGPAVREAAQRLLGADRVTLILLGAGAGEAAEKLPARVRGLHEAAVFVREVAADVEVVEALAPGAGEVLVQRLRAGDRDVALLAAAREQGRRGFGERDLRRLSLLAGSATLAIENARLHAEVALQTDELRAALDRLVVAERLSVTARLASSLGHELSNPACAVLASLEVAQLLVAAGRPGEVAEHLARAHTATTQILGITSALRPLGRGGAQRRRDPVGLRQVIESAAMIAAYELRRRARLVIDVDPELPALTGDAAALTQVFLNLLLNAAQAMPGGDSSLEHEIRVEAVATPERDAVVARVRDDGPGVAPELEARLFEPSVTTRAVAAGHGMGLAVCRWIVEQAGGTISYRRGSPGAIFEIRLPL